MKSIYKSIEFFYTKLNRTIVITSCILQFSTLCKIQDWILRYWNLSNSNNSSLLYESTKNESYRVKYFATHHHRPSIMLKIFFPITVRFTNYSRAITREGEFQQLPALEVLRHGSSSSQRATTLIAQQCWNSTGLITDDLIFTDMDFNSHRYAPRRSRVIDDISRPPIKTGDRGEAKNSKTPL